VAQLFNETPDQLMNDLRSSNSSLSQLAQAKGVSQDDLVAAIKQGLQSSSTGTSPLSDTQLTNIASRIANHKHGGHHHHHGGGASTTNPTQSVPGADPSQLDVQRLLQDLQNVRQFDQSL
jgi:hypothetical protein